MGRGVRVKKLNVGVVLVPTGGSVFMQVGRGRKWHLPAPLFLGESPSDLCLLGTGSQTSKSLFLPYALGIFQTAASTLYLCGYSVFLMAGTQLPVALHAF